MAGWDTLRGVSFQHAVAILEAIKLLEDASASELRIEGTADIVDLQAVSEARLESVQVRSRQEPYSWTPAELASVATTWLASPPADSEELRFVSDAPLSRDSARRLLPAIDRAKNATDSDDDRAYLAQYGLPADPAVLRRIRFETRSAPTTSLLATAGLRMLSLLQASRPATVADAEDAIARLFQAIATRGGEADLRHRTFTRFDLARAAGVDLGGIDAGDTWSQEIREAYISSIAEATDPSDPLATPEPAITTSGALVALRVSEEDSPQDGQTIQLGQGLEVPDLTNVYLLGLVGEAGSGKSTSLRLLARTLAQQGALPLPISAGAYVEADLVPRVKRMIERLVGRSLRPRAAEEALASTGATLVLDGLTGLTSETNLALVQDVRALRERLPGLRLAAADRDARVLRRLGLTIFELSPLDAQKRLELAIAIVGGESADAALDAIRERVPAALGNPLLLTMALRLLASDVAASTRSALYEEAINALRQRSDQQMSDAELAAVTHVAVELVRSDQYEADRYWWLVTLRSELDTLATGGVFTLANVTAEAALESALAIGLLTEGFTTGSIGFLHDSFRDYLAAIALERQVVPLPAEFAESWESAAEMFAEVISVTPEVIAAARSNIVLCSKLAPLDRDEEGVRGHEVPELTRSLIELHLGCHPSGMDLDSMMIHSCYTDSYRYVLLVPEDGSGDGVVQISELAESVGSAKFVFAWPPDRGPLSIAFGVWRELLSLTTLAEDLGGRRAVPEDDNEVLELIRADFIERQALLPQVAEALVPTLAERLVAEVGWHGLIARLAEPHPTGLGAGYVQTERWLFFDTRAETLDVAIEEPTSAQEFPERARLDDYVTRQPRAAVMEALVEKLRQLVPPEDLRE